MDLRAKAETATAPWKIIAFSKPFAQLSPDDTADLVADVWWDGIECPVRSKAGQITPEAFAALPPEVQELLRQSGQVAAA